MSISRGCRGNGVLNLHDKNHPLALWLEKSRRKPTFQVKVLLTVWDEVVLRVCRSAFFGQAWLPPITALPRGEVGTSTAAPRGSGWTLFGGQLEISRRSGVQFGVSGIFDPEKLGGAGCERSSVFGSSGAASMWQRGGRCWRSPVAALQFGRCLQYFGYCLPAKEHVGISPINQQNWGSYPATVGIFMYFITKTRDLHPKKSGLNISHQVDFANQRSKGWN